MPVHLLDVNVLIALLTESHSAHDVARHWFRGHRAEGYATCPITQLGFIRITSAPKPLPTPMTPRQAASLLLKWTSTSDHSFWPDDVDAAGVLADVDLIGHRQTTDAYFIALARHHGGVLTTFDRGLHGRPDVQLII